MDEFARAAFREREARRILRRRVFWLHASIYLATSVALTVVWAAVGGGYPWFVFPILGWGIGVVAHAAVAFLMEMANAMQDHLRGGGARDAGWDHAVQTLVKLLNPLAPHMCEEMWERLGMCGLLADAPWPVFDAAAAAEPRVTLVVTVAGKVRDKLEVQPGLSEADATSVALASEKVRAALDGGKPKKVVYVRDKLINLVP